MIYIAFIIIMGLLGGESGCNWPWSKSWQERLAKYKAKQCPEWVTATILASISFMGYTSLGLDLQWFFDIPLFIAVWFIILSGIESGTWMFLNWDDEGGYIEEGRTATLQTLVTWIADKFGFGRRDEGFAWVAATVKGTIITLPMGGLGGILFALGYEIGSHLDTRWPKNWIVKDYAIKEALSFIGVGIYAIFFLWLAGF